MKYRRFGRTGWKVSEIGYGMWGMASWSNSNDDESLQSLQAAVDRGCTFFDTAYAYGNGRSENLLGQIIRSNSGKRLYTATKIPPKNLQWPALAESTLMQWASASIVGNRGTVFVQCEVVRSMRCK